MKKIIYIILFFAILSINCKVNRTPDSSGEIQPLCEILSAPNDYFGRSITTAGIVLGYHEFIVYDPACLEESKVAKLVLSYEQRASIVERTREIRETYVSPIIKSNVYAKIRFRGRVEQNLEGEARLNEHVPSLQFYVDEILDINAVEGEILPPNN